VVKGWRCWSSREGEREGGKGGRAFKGWWCCTESGNPLTPYAHIPPKRGCACAHAHEPLPMNPPVPQLPFARALGHVWHSQALSEAAGAGKEGTCSMCACPIQSI
jgi:hypothetical protein